jgi:hypothetical protein
MNSSHLEAKIEALGARQAGGRLLAAKNVRILVGSPLKAQPERFPNFCNWNRGGRLANASSVSATPWSSTTEKFISPPVLDLIARSIKTVGNAF